MRNKLTIKSLLVLVAAVFVTGCASTSHKKDTSNVSTVLHNDDPIRELTSLSAEAVDELRLIAKTRDYEQYKNLSEEEREQRRRLALMKLPGFDTKVTIDFEGEAHVAAETLAVAAGYDFIRPTTKPAKPLIVVLKGENKPLMEYLKMLGAKTGRVAAIQVHTVPRKTLEFNYHTEVRHGR